MNIFTYSFATLAALALVCHDLGLVALFALSAYWSRNKK